MAKQINWNWDVTQCRFVVSYRRFGTTYRFHLQGSRNPRTMPGTLRQWNGWWLFLSILLGRLAWPLKMAPIRCPETSVTNYQSTLHNIPEEWRSYLQSGGSLKSLTARPYLRHKMHDTAGHKVFDWNSNTLRLNWSCDWLWKAILIWNFSLAYDKYAKTCIKAEAWV